MVKAKQIHPVVANLGRSIFLYCNIHTNQVVYSLTRSLNNHSAIKQLTFVGKKSVPRAIRKDLWTPLASVHFPKPTMGLRVFHKLREFRKMHETQYPVEILTTTSLKERKRYLMNQKGNSIADLAESLKIEIQKANESAVTIEPGGVEVRWQNTADGQYAGEWPQVVQHSAAERAVRYTAPPIPGEGGTGRGKKEKKAKKAKKAMLSLPGPEKARIVL